MSEPLTPEERVRAFIDAWDTLSQHDEQIHSIAVRSGTFTLTTTDIRDALDAARASASAPEEWTDSPNDEYPFVAGVDVVAARDPANG